MGAALGASHRQWEHVALAAQEALARYRVASGQRTRGTAAHQHRHRAMVEEALAVLQPLVGADLPEAELIARVDALLAPPHLPDGRLVNANYIM